MELCHEMEQAGGRLAGQKWYRKGPTIPVDKLYPNLQRVFAGHKVILGCTSQSNASKSKEVIVLLHSALGKVVLTTPVQEGC